MTGCERFAKWLESTKFLYRDRSELEAEDIEELLLDFEHQLMKWEEEPLSKAAIIPKEKP